MGGKDVQVAVAVQVAYGDATGTIGSQALSTVGELSVAVQPHAVALGTIAHEGIEVAITVQVAKSCITNTQGLLAVGKPPAT
jgi:hypothetical protein